MTMSIPIAVMLAMLALANDPIDDARKAFSNCLVEFSIEHLDLKTSVGAFRKASQTACEAKRDIYRGMIAKEDIASGSTKSEAKQFADEEVENITKGFVDSYGQHVSGNTRPVKEQ